MTCAQRWGAQADAGASGAAEPAAGAAPSEIGRSPHTSGRSRRLEALVRLSTLVGLVVASCAPATAPPPAEPQSAAPFGAPKSLAIALQGEPRNLIPLLGGDVGGTPAGRIEDAVHQHLATYDHRGEVRPMLVAELPSQSKGTWLLRPDGTMETTYRLRPNVAWHDGAPLTARDVAFGWMVTMDPDLPVESRTVARQISRIDTPDDLTFVIEWAKVYPLADTIVEWDLGPLPTHLLEATYRTDKERFERSPYWNREFIGLGPYRLAEWELGSHIVVKAYESYYRGAPKIQTVTFRFIPNEPTVVANLLAGTVDGQFRAISFNQVMFVKEEWERVGKKPVAIGQPTTWRVMDVQYRDQHRDPQLRDLLDARVRRALLHAIDRIAMVEHLYRGQAPVADTFISPTDVKWDWVKDAVVRHEYDPRSAQELLRAAGWQRGADGVFLNHGGERVTIPLWTTEGGQWQDEMAITGDYWKAIGVGVDQYVIPTAQSRDRRLRATFPGFSSTSAGPVFLNIARSFHSGECSSERTRWVGANRGCYQNPGVDQIVDELLASVDPAVHRRLGGDLVRLYTEELPGLPLYFTIQVIFFREGVSGVVGGARPSGSDTWNIAEWDIL